MTITKRGFICLTAGLLAASLFAGHHHRPLPHGTPAGAYWCTKCGGDGYNWTWYGWKKTCGVCDGRGWLVKHAPPPPPAVVPHHGKQGQHPPKAAPKHGPAGKASPPKGGHGGPRR